MLYTLYISQTRKGLKILCIVFKIDKKFEVVKNEWIHCIFTYIRDAFREKKVIFISWKIQQNQNYFQLKKWDWNAMNFSIWFKIQMIISLKTRNLKKTSFIGVLVLQRRCKQSESERTIIVKKMVNFNRDKMEKFRK